MIPGTVGMHDDRIVYFKSTRHTTSKNVASILARHEVFFSVSERYSCTGNILFFAQYS